MKQSQIKRIFKKSRFLIAFLSVSSPIIMIFLLNVFNFSFPIYISSRIIPISENEGIESIGNNFDIKEKKYIYEIYEFELYEGDEFVFLLDSDEYYDIYLYNEDGDEIQEAEEIEDDMYLIFLNISEEGKYYVEISSEGREIKNDFESEIGCNKGYKILENKLPEISIITLSHSEGNFDYVLNSFEQLYIKLNIEDDYEIASINAYIGSGEFELIKDKYKEYEYSGTSKPINSYCNIYFSDFITYIKATIEISDYFELDFFKQIRYFSFYIEIFSTIPSIFIYFNVLIIFVIKKEISLRFLTKPKKKLLR